MRQGIFFGHLGRDAEIQYTDNGTAVCKFPLGVSAGTKQNPKTLWIDCAIFGDRAQSALPQYLTKGTPLVVSGDQDFRVWQGQNGPGGAIQLAVNKVTFAGGGQSQGQNPAAAQNQGGQQRPPQNNPPQNQPPQNQPAYGGPQQGHTANQPDPVDDFDSDIPF